MIPMIQCHPTSLRSHVGIMHALTRLVTFAWAGLSLCHVTPVVLWRCHSVEEPPAIRRQQPINGILLSPGPKTDIRIKRLGGSSRRIFSLFKYILCRLSQGVCEILWHRSPLRRDSFQSQREIHMRLADTHANTHIHTQTHNTQYNGYSLWKYKMLVVRTAFRFELNIAPCIYVIRGYLSV